MRSFLFCCIILAPLGAQASLASCLMKLGLYNPVISDEYLGSGNNAYTSLEVRADGSLRKTKRYKYNQEEFLPSDVRDANFAADILQDTQGVKASRYTRTFATAAGFKNEVEVEYFPGDTVAKKLKDLEPEAAKAFKAEYSAAIRKTIEAFIKSKRIDRVILEPDGTRAPALELKSVEDLNNLPEKYVKLIGDGYLTFDAIEKAFLFPNSDKLKHEYYIKPDNFVHTPDNEFVMIDPL